MTLDFGGGDDSYSGPASESWEVSETMPARRTRRRWTAQEKAQITAESFSSGATVTDVAHRHGVSVNLLYNWRSKVRHRQEEVRLVPVTIDDRSRGVMSHPAPIEIEIGGACVRIRGAVDGLALKTVLSAIRFS